MPSTREVIASRLREARKRLRLTQADVAAALGVHRPTISEMEAGRRAVTSEELYQLSQIYAVPVHRLLGEGGLGDDVLTGALFREGGMEGPAIRSAVLRFLEGCRTKKELEGLLGHESAARTTPRLSLAEPRTRDEAIRQGERMAELERRRLDLGGEPVRNPVELLDRQGIRVGPLTVGDHGGPDGLFVESAELGPCIGLSTRAGDTRGARQAFTAAHEYAHWLLKDRLVDVLRGPQFGTRDLLEVRANSFAVAFLMPAEGLREYFRSLDLLKNGHLEDLSAATLVRATDHFGVSRRALLYRLQNVELLNATQASGLRKGDLPFDAIRRALGLRTRRPEPVGWRLETLSREAWKRGLISSGRAAGILGLDLEEFLDRMKLFQEVRYTDPREPLIGAAGVQDQR
jgi:Zn-dependent peptidase ImmA (M78 family)/transcriptional regulator with XRE-family HTH domain